jgi:hypothetical protein
LNVDGFVTYWSHENDQFFIIQFIFDSHNKKVNEYGQRKMKEKKCPRDCSRHENALTNDQGINWNP